MFCCLRGLARSRLVSPLFPSGMLLCLNIRVPSLCPANYSHVPSAFTQIRSNDFNNPDPELVFNRRPPFPANRPDAASGFQRHIVISTTATTLSQGEMLNPALPRRPPRCLGRIPQTWRRRFHRN